MVLVLYARHAGRQRTGYLSLSSVLWSSGVRVTRYSPIVLLDPLAGNGARTDDGGRRASACMMRR